MPTDTEKAPLGTPETSRSGGVAVAAMDSVAPAGQPVCGCDECQDVDRDEMWTRWA